MSKFLGAPIDISDEEETSNFSVLELDLVDAKRYYVTVEKKRSNPECPLCIVKMTHTEMVKSLF